MSIGPFSRVRAAFTRASESPRVVITRTRNVVRPSRNVADDASSFLAESIHTITTTEPAKPRLNLKAKIAKVFGKRPASPTRDVSREHGALPANPENFVHFFAEVIPATTTAPATPRLNLKDKIAKMFGKRPASPTTPVSRNQRNLLDDEGALLRRGTTVRTVPAVEPLIDYQPPNIAELISVLPSHSDRIHTWREQVATAIPPITRRQPRSVVVANASPLAPTAERTPVSKKRKADESLSGGISKKPNTTRPLPTPRVRQHFTPLPEISRVTEGSLTENWGSELVHISRPPQISPVVPEFVPESSAWGDEVRTALSNIKHQSVTGMPTPRPVKGLSTSSSSSSFPGTSATSPTLVPTPASGIKAVGSASGRSTPDVLETVDNDVFYDVPSNLNSSKSFWSKQVKQQIKQLPAEERARLNISGADLKNRMSKEEVIETFDLLKHRLQQK